jgi:hypothetical protein
VFHDLRLSLLRITVCSRFAPFNTAEFSFNSSALDPQLAEELWTCCGGSALPSSYRGRAALSVGRKFSITQTSILSLPALAAKATW